MSTPTELGELLGGAWRAFSRRGQARFSEHGLSAARVRLLVSLAAVPNVRMRDLADRLGVSGRAITPLVDALEADGLVARHADPADRRAFRLGLTEAGTAQLQRIEELQRTISAEIFSGLTAEQRDQLGMLLMAFLTSADTQPDQACPERA
ncbi:MarR family transcriptional regulator [Acrocarpospora corrugata]|uniref:MarR family transcriptional regulator n=1 Tax=Acrocarpospora corrugata TaxID=35763 RepID=A0A5M3WDA7_9ACTN|nr:MarR family transcriptional regulator [Acrocarpospora corrugata]GES06250.1 MarR family transcriptional regulator [Acrocarpospora corrugata]